MDFEHGGNVWDFDDKVVDFSANINPLGVPEGVKKAIISAVDNVVYYPDPECRELRRTISAIYDLPTGNITVNTGATGVIYDLVRVVSPSSACIVVPSFSEYEKALKLVGADINFVYLSEEDGFKLPLEELLGCISDVNIVFICNPNNPTGNLFDIDQILYLIKKASRYGVFVVVDEAFIDWIPGFSLLSCIREVNNLFVIRSLTKFFAMPGLRVGYGVGPERLIEYMEEENQPWIVGLLPQVAAVSALRDNEYKRRSLEYIDMERRRIFKMLSDINMVRVYPSVTNFILLKLLGEVDSVEVRKRLLKRGILVRSCHNFRGLGRQYIRVAIKRRKENDALIESLEKIWKE